MIYKVIQCVLVTSLMLNMRVQASISEKRSLPDVLLTPGDYSLFIQSPYKTDPISFIPSFSFLEKTGPGNNCFKEEAAQAKEFLTSDNFYALAKNFNPQNFKEDLENYLTSLVSFEMQKITKYFHDIKVQRLCGRFHS